MTKRGGKLVQRDYTVHAHNKQTSVKGHWGAYKKASPQRARELYLVGFEGREIQHRLRISRITLHRYYKETGGLSLEDKITHLQNRKKFDKHIPV